jgi:hypothetical protein
MKCHFCLNAATSVCTFKQADPRIIFPEDIQELDLVQDDLSLVYRPVKKVVIVNGDVYACVKFAIEKRKTMDRHMRRTLPCLRMEIHPCGNHVCDLHIRELDDDLSWCAEHWPEEKMEVYGTN